MSNPSLTLLNHLFAPKKLTYIQEIVFLRSLAGERYSEIASATGYDFDYVKEVGAQLWNQISRTVGKPVTKKNVRLVLADWLATTPSSSGRLAPSPAIDADSWEFPSGPVPFYSQLYIARPELEARLVHELHHPGSLVHLKAPQQMGKTSLVLRSLAVLRSQGFHTVMINWQHCDRAQLRDLDRCLRWLCYTISRELGIKGDLDTYWDPESGSKISCTTYLETVVLSHFQQPIVLVMDELHCLFEYPDLMQDVLPLLRSWHEESASNPLWQKLRLVLVYSSDQPIPLRLHQSPLNVGMPLELPEFTLEQIQELADRHQFAEQGIAFSDLAGLLTLVGGHPYLLRLAFYAIAQGITPLPVLIQEAASLSGIYRHHLQRLWNLLQSDRPLWHTFQTVLQSPYGCQIPVLMAHRLESLGLIHLRGNLAVPRYELYCRYFTTQVEVSPDAALETLEAIPPNLETSGLTYKSAPKALAGIP